MYYRKHKTGEKAVRRRAIAGVTAIILLISAADLSMRPMMRDMLEYQAQQAFTAAVNEAVSDVRSADCFVVVSADSSGRISSIQTDAAAVNEYRAALSNAAAENIRRLETEPIEIPIGTLTGSRFLTGRGPEVSMRLVERGSVTTDIISNFSEAGINQTRHTLVCRVSADFYAIIPGMSMPTALSADFIVAESVIVGDVPDSFTYVYGDQSDTIGRIFDYGDPYGENVAAD